MNFVASLSQVLTLPGKEGIARFGANDSDIAINPSSSCAQSTNVLGRELTHPWCYGYPSPFRSKPDTTWVTLYRILGPIFRQKFIFRPADSVPWGSHA
jgi:hypothetical protein